jgi:hypothetical protein
MMHLANVMSVYAWQTALPLQAPFIGSRCAVRPMLCENEELTSPEATPGPSTGRSYYEGFFLTPLAENRGDGTEQALKLAMGTLGTMTTLLLGFLAANGLLPTQTPPASSASNLPISTGATGRNRGSISALRPVVEMSDSLRSAMRALPETCACESALSLLPTDEILFKRAFDEYSEGVTYKQLYRDQNAFLVYYTRGFDGQGRASIEVDSPQEARQRAQFGARNEAWLGLEDARAEIRFLKKISAASGSDTVTDTDGEVLKALERAVAAFDNYLSLAPAQQLEQARGG